MPDANGNFKGISVPAGAWQRIFGDLIREELFAFADDVRADNRREANRDKSNKSL